MYSKQPAHSAGLTTSRQKQAINILIFVYITISHQIKPKPFCFLIFIAFCSAYLRDQT